MQKKITNSAVNKARESGREAISTFKTNKQKDESIRRTRLAQLNQRHINAVNTKGKNQGESTVEAFQRFHAARNNDPAPAGDYVNEILSARERGRVIMNASKKGERNFPPARQVVKP